ncbi:MAG: hypothetical protein LBJ31_08165 [Treponema sp.]|jgi:hypothetical protein|nr:hypothetical protein [Treponema sp.]
MRNELKPNLKLAENTFPKILKLLKKADILILQNWPISFSFTIENIFIELRRFLKFNLGPFVTPAQDAKGQAFSGTEGVA